MTARRPTARPVPIDNTRLDRAGVAALCGYVGPGTITKMLLRGRFPKPDGYVGRSPWWWRETISEWNATERRGVGQPQHVNGNPPPKTGK